MSIVNIYKSRDVEEKVKAVTDSPNKFLNIPDATKVWLNSWPNQPTNADILRASGMYYVCPREFVLNYWQPKPSKSFDWAAYLKMSTGTHLHDYLQNYILGPMGVLYGKWVEFEEDACTVKNTTEGFHPDPDKAVHEISKQDPLTYHYKEPTVFHKKYRISGHLDGFIDARRINWIYKAEKLFKNNPLEACNQLRTLDPGDKFHLEIKTVSKYQFDKVVDERAIPDYYKMQACIYQKLSEIFRTVFLYIERDTMRSKVLLYKYDEGWWKEASRKAKIIWRAIRDETLPESMMACKLPTDDRAKKCVFRNECWLKSFDFKKYVEDGKKRAEKEGRKLLNLSKWED